MRSGWVDSLSLQSVDHARNDQLVVLLWCRQKSGWCAQLNSGLRSSLWPREKRKNSGGAIFGLFGQLCKTEAALPHCASPETWSQAAHSAKTKGQLMIRVASYAWHLSAAYLPMETTLHPFPLTTKKAVPILFEQSLFVMDGIFLRGLATRYILKFINLFLFQRNVLNCYSINLSLKCCENLPSCRRNSHLLLQ